MKQKAEQKRCCHESYLYPLTAAFSLFIVVLTLTLKDISDIIHLKYEKEKHHPEDKINNHIQDVDNVLKVLLLF